MRYKEKEKLLLSKVKELRDKDWKFKGWFIYKNLNNFFFSCTFYVSLKENRISGYLDFKPMGIDNVFWDIIDEQPNKRMPLSFREEAAFCVHAINIYRYDIEIEDVANPDNEIVELLKIINEKVKEKSKIVNSSDEFRVEMMKDEETNAFGIITSLIEEQKFKDALEKIQEYRSKNYYPGFGSPQGDFYDVAEKYIKNCG